MLRMLQELVDAVATLNNKLVLVIGPPCSGKTRLLHALGEHRQLGAINVGAVLGRRLLEIPSGRRHAHAIELFRDVTNANAFDGLVLLDNIELLFDRSLLLNPLDLLKRQAQGCRVVAAWPGELEGVRLTYAAKGHPEHQDYGIDGLVPFIIH